MSTKTKAPSFAHELESTHLSESVSVTGDFAFSDLAKIYGKVKGHIRGAADSILILAESSVIEATVEGETIIISGYVKGSVKASKKVTLTRSARVFGNIDTPTIHIEFGAVVEGQTKTTLRVSPKNRDLALSSQPTA